MKKTRLFNLSRKTLAIATASLSMLNSQRAIATPHVINNTDDELNIGQRLLRNKMFKPKLTLRLNPYRPGNSRLAYHSSHSSHSSHASHSSHSSGGYSSGSSDGGDGAGLGVLAVGGALLYGAYRIGKGRSNHNIPTK
jgi:uncharacterized membrane protein YgcG